MATARTLVPQSGDLLRVRMDLLHGISSAFVVESDDFVIIRGAGFKFRRI